MHEALVGYLVGVAGPLGSFRELRPLAEDFGGDAGGEEDADQVLEEAVDPGFPDGVFRLLWKPLA